MNRKRFTLQRELYIKAILNQLSNRKSPQSLSNVEPPRNKIELDWPTFPGLPAKIRTTEALSLSTSGNGINCAAIVVTLVLTESGMPRRSLRLRFTSS